MPLIDYQEVKRWVDMDSVLGLLHWTATRRDRKGAHGPCPLHGSTRPGSSSLSVSSRGFYCWSCKRRGDCLRFYAEALRLPIYEATILLCARLGLAVPWKGQARRPSRKSPPEQ